MMNREMMETIADRLIVTARVARIYKDSYENKRNCPFVSELKGMELMLKAMEIPFEFTYDENFEISGVTVGTDKDSVTVTI